MLQESFFLETKNVIKRYAGHLALDNVSIQVPRGKIFGLLGPNGAGKTTLIRIINRITAPDSGEVIFKGNKMFPADVYNIGYLPEERGLYQKMKVGEQAVYLARLKGLPIHDAQKGLTLWFEKFGIMDWWNKRLEELSKGMQQKVQFIITVVHDPELLIFDEPFSGFDPVNADLLKKEILELKEKGKTIIFSTHNMSSVEEICDEFALIRKSQVVLNGNVEEVRSRYKKDTFILKIDNLKNLPNGSNLFSILEEKPFYYGKIIRIKKRSKNVSNADLITQLSTMCNILSFEEEIPSMNDIFIRTVS